MAGNENSGRDSMFEDPILVHFNMEKVDADKLKILARKYTKGNRSDLILQTMLRFIKHELG